jgi:hypothetical protein
MESRAIMRSTAHLFSLSFSVLLLSVVAQGVAQDVEDPIEEEIRVFESRITLDFPGMSYREVKRIRPSGLVIVEDGAPREVTSLLPLADEGDWRTVVYVDAPTVRSLTTRTAALALGGYMERLTELGTVEIVIADPVPRTSFRARRQAVMLEEAMARLSKTEIATNQLDEMRKAFTREIAAGGDRSELARAAIEAEVALARQQADHLITFASSGGDGRPTVLFLISDGYYEDPESFYLDEDVRSTSTRRTGYDTPVGARISEEVAQTFSAFEWIVVTLPIRQDQSTSGVGIRPTSDFDSFYRQAGGVEFLPKARDRDVDIDLGALEVNIAPVLQPLRKLSDQTAGRTVRHVGRLAGAVEFLENLWRAHYLTTRPFDGALRPAAARLVRGARNTSLPFARDSTRVETPSWVRSSTPSPLVAARLRGLLGGTTTKGTVEIALSQALEDGTTTLEIAVDWRQPEELLAKEKVRLSLAFVDPARGPEVRHHLFEGGEPDDEGLWHYELQLTLPEDRGPVAIVLEALRPVVWGSTLLE